VAPTVEDGDEAEEEIEIQEESQEVEPLAIAPRRSNRVLPMSSSIDSRIYTSGTGVPNA
jgi:hypothetical protein